MCDACSEILDLLPSYDLSTPWSNEKQLKKAEISVICTYVQSWLQRQCICCYKDPKNFDRFNHLIQGTLWVSIVVLEDIVQRDKVPTDPPDGQNKQEPTDEQPTPSVGSANSADGNADVSCGNQPVAAKWVLSESWSAEETEKLLHFVSKIFLLNFPHYTAFKHSVHSKIEEVSQQEMTALSMYCDINDTEIPIHLLRNVCYFCEVGGLQAMETSFAKSDPDVLPFPLVRSMVAVVANLKLWMGVRAIVKYLVPLRSNVIRYMCKLSDKDLRQAGSRALSEFMWTGVKDPLDTHLPFDKEGLELAFKYFVSSTLTMRLAGIAQINSHINMYTELCNSEAIADMENIGTGLSDWLTHNKIIENIFGPNLHVEIIKQSHIVLNFLAMEGRISKDHIDCIWSATQLKHCTKQVHDLLPPLIKHLEAGPALHFYHLLGRLEPHENTEQTLYLASALLKFIWSNSTHFPHVLPQSASSIDFGRVDTVFVSALGDEGDSVAQTLEGSFCQEQESQGCRHADVGESGMKLTIEELCEGNLPPEIGLVLAGRRKPGSRSKLQRVSGRKRQAARTSSSSSGESDSDGDECPERGNFSSGAAPSVNSSTTTTTTTSSSNSESEEDLVDVHVGRNEVVTRKRERCSIGPRPRWSRKKSRPQEQLEASVCEVGEVDEAVQGTPWIKCGENPEQPQQKQQELGEPQDDQEKQKGFECMQYVGSGEGRRQRIRVDGGPIEDILSPDDGSCSSRMSTKSEKNMADFEGEESGCEDELIQLSGHPHLSGITSAYCAHLQRASALPVQRCPQRFAERPNMQFDIANVCQPGQTLLWDLMQDDKVGDLGQGLALEAEKIFSSLVCWSSNRPIRMKFIEGCLENLARHRSVPMSLRLLPRLFSSFQPSRGHLDTHGVTMWAEKEHHMMDHFFSDLVVYTEGVRSGKNQSNSLYSHQVEIQVRLQFLNCVFSSLGSADSFRLTGEQISTLWFCLATDPEVSDELFSWLLSQVKDKDQHALGPETLQLLYTTNLPLLQPENMSMTALNLFQQLGGMLQHEQETLAVDNRGMDHLWGIALRAHNTDVSMAAIQYINSYYVNAHHRSLNCEEEFIERCMNSLKAAACELEKAEEASLLILQRGLLLLTVHLETFQRRYAYHLRTWHLAGNGIYSHQRPLLEKQASLLRVVCQPAGLSEKVTLEMLGSDYVAELRAEVTQWWERFQRQQKEQQKEEPVDSTQQANFSRASTSFAVVEDGKQQSKTPPSTSSTSSLTPILGAMLTEGPIRVITQGQELTADFDERTLQELGFKDMQLVFVSVGAVRLQRRREGPGPPSCLPPPPRERVPMLLLLRPHYLEQLFQLMQQLSALCTTASSLGHNSHTKGRLLSWRVWELLMMLPTCPVTLEAFQTLGDETFERLLNPTTPHRLMYCLQVVESLALSRRGRCHQAANESSLGVRISSPSDLGDDGEDDWAQRFVDKGGLRHLFGIFTSGSLRKKPDTLWDEWSQDCLSCVLKLIYQLGIDPLDAELVPAAPSESGPSTTPRHRMKRQKSCSDKLEVPRLNDAMLAMMSSVENVVESIASILLDAGLTRPWAGSIMTPYQMGGWGRGQLIHYTLVLLLSWAFSCNRVKDVLFGDPSLVGWIKVLLLEDPEPCIRREVCSSLYRLCLGSSPDRRSGQHFVAPLLQRLLEFLSEAQNMKPFRIDFSETDEKEPYGPACRDYYWLVCRLVGSLQDFEEDSSEVPKLACQLDLDSMARQLASAILDRDFLEGRHNTVEDDGLVGLICLCTAVIKHNPPFKFSQEGQEFLRQMFNCLFALPSPKQRHLPKCKSQSSRAAAYDLLVDLTRDSLPNYKILHASLLQQHTQDMSRCSFDADCHTPYPWDYWPHEDGRSDCGYVGLTNLGATCYMASCMQHLYMMPQARASILSAKCNIENKHESMLVELQRMFAYLLESERKAYNPRSFCKVYTMDHQPLNTGEQKDMAEFFTDLISKLEETTPQLRELVKTLFCGVITNNVVSLDCPHVSCTLEEFYTVRCQVADMRNLYESLDEVTVKDTLEGDNMYTCSQCVKKVRAEKRACFKKLPRILCFNTMRYTFNMVTMTKEKVNTHFSFPLRLDMAKYTERNLMPGQHLGADTLTHQQENFEYDLIGVTVHTGTADGGHYYSFIRDRTANNRDKWFLFNDAEVKPFDPSQIAAECFGGEMISKTYDSVTDKFMDFSFEKTNSAYMLFYERTNCPRSDPSSTASTSTATENRTTQELPKDLADWIWEDNMLFLQDKNIFEHNYFGFMWQVCSLVPQTLSQHPDVTLMAAKLSTSFVLETLIHAKEKPTMVQWIELLTKQFNSSQSACEWFLDHMVEHDWWPVQILICCPNQVVRQMFQRLCIHVINKLRPLHFRKFLLPIGTDNNDGSIQVGSQSCITRFIRRLLFLMEHNAGQHTKHLTEYFGFLLEFAKMGVEECRFMLAAGAISTMVSFYLGQRASDYQVEAVSDEEEEDDDEEVLTISEDKYRPAALEKMITLVALLVEKSRGEDQKLHLSNGDFNAVAGGKGFPFLRQQIRDNANLRQVCNLVFSLCRWNDAHDSLAVHIVKMILQSITQHPEQSQPFFKLLSMLVEFAGGPPGLPTFSALVISHIWEVAENCPQQCLEWLALQVPRNKVAHSWVIQGIDAWVEHFLLAHNNQRVRNAAACLLVSLVPSNHFKQAFRSARSVLGQQKEIPVNVHVVRHHQMAFAKIREMSPDAQLVLHQIYELLLRLLKRARLYADPAVHGNAKLMSYFALLTYCLVSRTEKLMFGQHFLDLWQLFQPKLSEPSIAIHHNKQALLIFWYQVCVDCPENVKLIVQNAHVTKNIAFNYILADHDDQEVVIFNRYMLPAYYGLLRLCCQQSRAFTRQLASHQNIQWAFKNITPYPTQYPVAVEELFKLMRLFATRYTDSSEQELREVTAFRRSTLQLYLTALEGRSCWVTLNAVLGILLEINEDRLFFICNDGLALIFESYFSLHVMYHEATACHVIADLVKLLAIAVEVLKCARMFGENKEVHQHAQAWKERSEAARKLLSMLNAYTPLNLQQVCIETLRELLLLYPAEMLQILVPSMLHVHMACYDNPPSGPPGPYFPRRDQKPSSLKSSIHARHPGLQMCLHPSMLEAPKGTDTDYHRSLAEYFLQYHLLVDIICRVAVNQDMVTDHLVNLSALVGLEGAHLHFAHFPKLWLDIHQVEQVDKKCIDLLCGCRYFADYVLLVLTDLRETLILPVIKRFIKLYISKVTSLVINEQTLALVGSLLTSLQAALELDIAEISQSIPRLHVDLHALSLLLSVDPSNPQRSQAIECLQKLSDKCKAFTEAEQQETEGGTSPIKRRKLSTSERFQPEEMPAESSLSPLSVATCSPQPPVTSLLQAVHVALNILNLSETNPSSAMPSCSSAPSS